MISFTVPGRPVSLNAGGYERRAGRGSGMRLSDRAVEYKVRVAAAARAAFAGCPMMERALLTVTAHFMAEADAGAPGKFVQDALQGIAYRNDSAVLLALFWKGVPDRENPRTEVTLREVTDDELQAGEVAIPVPPALARARPASSTLNRRSARPRPGNLVLPFEFDRQCITSQKPADFRKVLGPKVLEKLNRKRLAPSVRSYR